MQTLIKVSNKIKWYYIKLTSPLSSFKNWLLTNHYKLLTDLMADAERLDNKIDNLESKIDIDDIVSRVEDLEYYDFDEIQERAENAERKAEENDHMIESVKDRSETNQESIKNIKDDVRQIIGVDFKGIADRFEKLEERLLNRPLLEDLKQAMEKISSIDERVEANKLKIVQTQIDLQCDKNNFEYLKGIEYDEGKQERTEGNLSAMQKLTFEVCKYYGGDLNDFNNFYDIIKKYNVKEGK